MNTVKSKRSRHNAGFTLIEVLVVLLVISILAAILFPVFASARRKAQDTTCLANLQQISHAMTMYTSDYDGAYPMAVEGIVADHQVTRGTNVWSDMLLPYLHDRAFPVCPASDWNSELSRTGYSGYALNSRLHRNIGTRAQYSQVGHQEVVLTAPACTVILFEARLGMIDSHSPDTAATAEELNLFLGIRVTLKQLNPIFLSSRARYDIMAAHTTLSAMDTSNGCCPEPCAPTAKATESFPALAFDHRA